VTNQQSYHQIASALYLRAVLPAFEELAAVSPRAQSLMANWNCSVEFAVRRNGAATVIFQNGSVSVLPEHHPRSTVSLFFLSARQLVNQFSGHGFSLPLPRRGILNLPSLLRFQKLGNILQEEVERHPRLLLGVALASLHLLTERDTKAREYLRDCPPGLAEIGIPARELFGWVECKNGKMTSGRGRPPRTPDVFISFRDEETALAGLRGELDELAATGAGDLSVRGLLPFAETLGLIAARAAVYLKAPA
jgi:hypothetical protein